MMGDVLMGLVWAFMCLAFAFGIAAVILVFIKVVMLAIEDWKEGRF